MGCGLICYCLKFFVWFYEFLGVRIIVGLSLEFCFFVWEVVVGGSMFFVWEGGVFFDIFWVEMWCVFFWLLGGEWCVFSFCFLVCGWVILDVCMFSWLWRLLVLVFFYVWCELRVLCCEVMGVLLVCVFRNFNLENCVEWEISRMKLFFVFRYFFIKSFL